MMVSHMQRAIHVRLNNLSQPFLGKNRALVFSTMVLTGIC